MWIKEEFWDTYTYYCCHPGCFRSYPLYEPEKEGEEIEWGNFTFCEEHIGEVLVMLNEGIRLEDIPRKGKK